MATPARLRFCRLGVLKKIDPRVLVRLLRRFSSYFARRGVTLPSITKAATLEYSRLARVLASPDENTPDDLIDALFSIDEMATPTGIEVLQNAIQECALNVKIHDEATEHDIAIQFWLANRTLFERKHAETASDLVERFEHFAFASNQPKELTPPNKRLLAKFEKALDDWFFARKCGRGTKVIFWEDGSEWRFVIRHGRICKRDECLRNRKPSSVFYRPLRHAFVTLDLASLELRVNATGKTEVDRLRLECGRHLFDDEGAFDPSSVRYSLQPLRELGGAALAWFADRRIASVVLRELEVQHLGHPKLTETWKAKDLFAALQLHRREIPESATLVQAKIAYKLVGQRRERLVVIKPSRTAKYARDGDREIIEGHLQNRGFAHNVQSAEVDDDAEVLAGL